MEKLRKCVISPIGSQKRARHNPYRRACDSCRQLKKRCLPAGADSKCKHCEKLDYVCTFHYIHRRTGRPRGKNTKVVSESCEEKQDASRRSLAEGLIQGSSPPPQRHRAPGSFQEYQRVESLLQAALHSPRAAVSLSSGGIQPTAGGKGLPSAMVEETPPTSERQSPSETIEVEPATSNCSGRTFDAKSTSQTNEPTAYIRALTPAPVPHKTCALELPVYISGFKAVLSVKIHLPVLDPFDPASDSIFNITNYLTAFGWSPSSSESIQTECRELLRSLARIAKELIPIVRDKAAKSFLVLLSRLGQQVFLKRGMPVELCGLGMTKAVVQHEGNVKMIGFNQIAKLSSTG